jgi:hypothetical protein
MLSGDDTFTPPAPASQMYLYLANDEQEIWDDEGTLWAFRATSLNGEKVVAADPFNDANDYSDLGINDHITGRFIRVPEDVAKGVTTDQPPQQALEEWSNDHNVFQFIRVEDTAYDPTVAPGENPVMFFTDTGSGSVVEDPNTGQLMAGAGPFNRGRVLRMEFAPDNPRKVVDLSILLDGNLSADPFAGNRMRSPDNLGTSAHSLMVQEDTTSQLSRILRYDFDAVSTANPWSVIATVNDQDWESSGIVDASDFFGDGTWLLNVQAHDVRVGASETIDGITYKREGGQLILLTVDGS